MTGREETAITNDVQTLAEHSNISINLTGWPATTALISFAAAATICFCRYMDSQDKTEN